jgi:hypothetical protein
MTVSFHLGFDEVGWVATTPRGAGVLPLSVWALTPSRTRPVDVRSSAAGGLAPVARPSFGFGKLHRAPRRAFSIGFADGTRLRRRRIASCGMSAE